MSQNYLVLSEFYESCLQKFGPTPQGVDWPNQTDVSKRFTVMLDILSHEPTHTTLSLLDLGCGYGALLNHLNTHKPAIDIKYTGIDISDKMVQTAQTLFPHNLFQCQDILKNPIEFNYFDYVVLNGVLTEKRTLSWDEMVNFAQSLLTQAFKICRKGMAFNVMSPNVDWCDPNLFYWSFDELTTFLCQKCSRNIVIRQDYGLYEYTVYVYKQPRH